jgi:hypothetical protein
MAHDRLPDVQGVIETYQPARVLIKDWYEAVIEDGYDVVIANDLFPNVDQRLDLFLKRVLPRATEVRLALTYYNEPRFYFTKRVDADEILCMLAWDGSTVHQCLGKYQKYIYQPNFALLLTAAPSPFANRRQVCLVTLRGGGLE